MNLTFTRPGPGPELDKNMKPSARGTLLENWGQPWDTFLLYVSFISVFSPTQTSSKPLAWLKRIIREKGYKIRMKIALVEQSEV